MRKTVGEQSNSSRKGWGGEQKGNWDQATQASRQQQPQPIPTLCPVVTGGFSYEVEELCIPELSLSLARTQVVNHALFLGQVPGSQQWGLGQMEPNPLV